MLELGHVWNKSGVCCRGRALSIDSHPQRVRQFYAMRSEKRICAPPRLSEASPALPLKQFLCSSDSRVIVQRFFFSHLTPPGDRWCGGLGFASAGSVSGSSTLHIFREASHV